MPSIKSARTWSIVTLVLAVALLLAVVYVIAGSRNGLVSYPTAFGVLRQIGQCGAAVAVLAIVVGIIGRRSRSGGTQFAAVAAALMVGMVGYMYVYQVGPPPEPFMNDITTDLENPPAFSAVIPLRPENSNPIEHGGPEMAANQRQAHPEIEPVISTLAPAAAFDRALEVAESLGWDIVAQDRNTGVIEAVDTTPFFRFKDDVVVRVQADGQGSRVDLRSHSRIGLTDLGKNAARIMEFVRAYPL